ncbi:uncharacterized protein I303_101678 [Kwoniella dejecticola CBS 10117]|uniref:Uncharacterized protein n=1 Tax=Kwoniella dejecticola CBS 10117 TaxID=1296121 RepID=A0A1A6AD37_9TREE|nr:uncharacterized protein I303_02186 [Kwoniella dejecticola CBS 10117]OBR87970.1 hypothetical protein I303_02186 [Kwoniella dejecticola CBS 10117]
MSSGQASDESSPPSWEAEYATRMRRLSEDLKTRLLEDDQHRSANHGSWVTQLSDGLEARLRDADTRRTEAHQQQMEQHSWDLEARSKELETRLQEEAARRAAQHHRRMEQHSRNLETRLQTQEERRTAEYEQRMREHSARMKQQGEQLRSGIESVQSHLQGVADTMRNNTGSVTIYDSNNQPIVLRDRLMDIYGDSLPRVIGDLDTGNMSRQGSGPTQYFQNRRIASDRHQSSTAATSGQIVDTSGETAEAVRAYAHHGTQADVTDTGTADDESLFGGGEGVMTPGSSTVEDDGDDQAGSMRSPTDLLTIGGHGEASDHITMMSHKSVPERSMGACTKGYRRPYIEDCEAED